MNPEQAAIRAFRDALRSSAAVSALVGPRIYEDEAPQGAALPFVVLELVGGQDRHAIGSGALVLSRPVLAVRAVTEGTSYADADAIAFALHLVCADLAASVTLAGQTYLVNALGRVSPIRSAPRTEQKRYPQAGGRYRVLVRPA